MFGWWSEDFLIKNSNTPIYIYTTESGSNTMVIAITKSVELKPDNLYNWICVGQIYSCVNTINFNNLIGKNIHDDSLHQKKRQKLSQDEITFTSSKNYGWYSEEFVNKKNNFIFDRNNNLVPEPKIHKYLTPSNSTVLVTHVSSDLNNKPYFSDAVFIGEVTEYLETISFY
jgi:hypothetical protein